MPKLFRKKLATSEPPPDDDEPHLGGVAARAAPEQEQIALPGTEEAEPSRARSFRPHLSFQPKGRRQQGDIEVRQHSKTTMKSQRRAEAIERQTQTKVGGDLSVLTRKDDFYQPVTCIMAILTFATFVASCTIVTNHIMPGTESLRLEVKPCNVHLIGAADKAGVSLGAGVVEATETFKVDESGVLSCWRSCDGDDDTCEWSRGFGYCVQLNMTFEYGLTVPAASLVVAEPVFNFTDNSSGSSGNVFDGNCTNATTAGCAPGLPPPASPPPAPPPPEGMVDITVNASCPVLLPYMRLAGEIGSATATLQVEYNIQYEPDDWPGTGTPTQDYLMATYDAKGVPRPFNASYVTPYFAACDSLVEGVWPAGTHPKLDGLPMTGYKCARPSTGLATAAPIGTDPGAYMSTSCSIVDCRDTVEEATKALEVIIEAYTTPPYDSFPCETYGPPAKYADATAFPTYLTYQVAAGGNVEPVDPAVYPAFAVRKWLLIELIAFSLGVALATSICYVMCFFLCCREWWCQHPKFRKFQYF